MKIAVVAQLLVALTIAMVTSLLSAPSTIAEPLTSAEQRFLTKMLQGNAEFGAAPIVMKPGYSPNELVVLGHVVVDVVRSGVNPFDAQGLVMKANPWLSAKQGSRLVVQALWHFDPAVAAFYYTDASPLPPGCWVIRQIDLKCR